MKLLYFVLLVVFVSATPKTNSTEKKQSSIDKLINDATNTSKPIPVVEVDPLNTNETQKLIKELADAEVTRNTLKEQTKKAQKALLKQTEELAKEHKIRMKKIKEQSQDFEKREHLREQVEEAKLALLHANGSFVETKNDVAALKNYTEEEMKQIEYQRKIQLRDKIDAERRRVQIEKLKNALNKKQQEMEKKIKAQHEKEDKAFKIAHQRLLEKFDKERKIRKDALMKKEMELRKMRALEFEKFRTEVEMERKMKRLTIEETQKQLLNLRKAEEIKREIVREGIRYKKLLEQQKMKKAEEKAKMIEDLKDKAVNLMLQKEDLNRKRKIEATELMNEVANAKKEIETNIKITKKGIQSRRERKAAIRTATIRSERTKMRYLKIKALKDILSKKLAAEERIYKKKLEEQKKIKALECKARGLVKRLSNIAKEYNKRSIEVIKKVKAEKKALLIRKMLLEKADEINEKRSLINQFKLKIRQLEEQELKHQMQLSGVEKDILNQRTLAKIIRMKTMRERMRRKRILALKKNLRKMYLERRDMLWKKRCIRFRKTANMKQNEELRKRKIARIICGKKYWKKQAPKKCYDFIGGKYHDLIHKPGKNIFRCPFEKYHGITKCDSIELP
ncbi:hypothetical protein ENUP19_0041G0012 [Entamoeba nuttalli]|uniref:Nuclease sbcCD subunit C n=2 Tax=Entamoeba nuttalli TaxID=412467 RepID=K2GJR4_ENTNP|nr:hypothetical protein ENU1_000730 [Entamoeba nuttalli P19]EKE43036.1 hypothetical protein ENU1_000730 [Entamoeba nuttalli P19]|eukprot:XP_008854629.1 hypothetical protein ENU1_000730 [Entamoeba nuttalli P19]